jgi:hypothetical protein
VAAFDLGTQAYNQNDDYQQQQRCIRFPKVVGVVVAERGVIVHVHARFILYTMSSLIK